MHRLWLGLACWGWLATAACARPTHILVDHPSTLQYSTDDKVTHRISDTPVAQDIVDLSLSGVYHFTGSGPGEGWSSGFTGYVVDTEKMVVPGQSVSLNANPSVRWDRIGMVATGLLAAAAIRLAWRARRLTEETSLLEKREAVLAASHSAAGLFPTDGSLPRSIPPYQVVDKLGSGGMAIVYRVQNAAGEQFALKLPLPNLLADPKYLQRFLREAKIGLRLRHPNLVSLLYVNDDANSACPWPYLVMELVEGQSLDRILEDRHLLPEGEAIAIILDVLAGLEVVHQNGIVHRDIKPSNVMMMPGGRARVMDFGVAHKQDTGGGKLTGTEEIIGTPRYMAPEQVASRSLDGRCDLYAVGAMLYEMLAGDIPYGTDDSYTILGLKCSMPLPPLASRCTVAPAVADLVDSMVALDADDRPASVAVVRLRLEAHLAATSS